MGDMGQSNKEKIKDTDRQGAAGSEHEKRNRFLKRLIVVLAVAIVATFTVFYVIYYRFSYQADKLTKETARIYAFGDGSEMADHIAPGYIEKYESKSKVLSVSDVQDIYIDKFRAYADEKIGDIDKIECKITDIQAVSNVEDLQQAFEDNGVKDVSQYRTVDADWIVTNENGDEFTIHIQEAILKCEDGWFVDYVMLPDEISNIGAPENVTEEQTTDDAEPDETDTAEDTEQQDETDTAEDTEQPDETDTAADAE